MSSRDFSPPATGRIPTRLLPLIAMSSLICFMPLHGEDFRSSTELFKAGKYAESVEACLRDLSEDPSNLDTYVLLCHGLLAQEKYKEVLRYGEKAHSLAKYDIRFIELCGEANYSLGRNEEALSSFRDFIVLSPEGTRVSPAYVFMGEIYIRLGMYQHADIAFSTAVQYDVNDARAWTRLGYAREQAGDLRYAKVAYLVAIGINPRLSDALLGLERVEKSMKN
jgi:tetratricopeptide (TPR) repeat protein